jgi:hypothetical protein
MTSNEENHPLLKLFGIKFLFDACIFKMGILSSVMTGARTSLVVSGKECKYQHYLHTICLFLGLIAKSYVLLY